MCPVTAGRPHPDHSHSVQALIPSLCPLITYMPVSHLSAAPTDLQTVSFQQLSGLVLATFKASTAAGELTLISGAVVLYLVLMLHATEHVRDIKKKVSSRLDNASMFACTKHTSSHHDDEFLWCHYRQL